MRGQLHALETILVAIVLMILLFLGIYVYHQVSTNELAADAQDYDVEDAQRVALQLTTLPETVCALEGGESRICIDKIKMEILSNWLNNPGSPGYDDQTRLYFVELFGPTDIFVEQVYPPVSPAAPIILFDGNDAEFVQAQSMPINLYDPRTNSVALGRLTVMWEATG